MSISVNTLSAARAAIACSRLGHIIRRLDKKKTFINILLILSNAIWNPQWMHLIIDQHASSQTYSFIALIKNCILRVPYCTRLWISGRHRSRRDVFVHRPTVYPLVHSAANQVVLILLLYPVDDQASTMNARWWRWNWPCSDKVMLLFPLLLPERLLTTILFQSDVSHSVSNRF